MWFEENELIQPKGSVTGLYFTNGKRRKRNTSTGEEREEIPVGEGVYISQKIRE